MSSEKIAALAEDLPIAKVVELGIFIYIFC